MTPDDASAPDVVLAINAGSSSLKFALYDVVRTEHPRVRGKIDRIGGARPTLDFKYAGAAGPQVRPLDVADHATAAGALMDWLRVERLLQRVAAVGHRIVHGGARYSAPAVVDDALVQALRDLSAFSPEHLPAEIDLLERFRAALPGVPQVACFDTAFHHALPRVAQIVPIPRRFEAKGIRRYGFHGLSYTFLIEELTRASGAECARGRLVLAHLGNGSSLAAVHHGTCIDTTMAFTPAAGVPMSTRSGDLDPGLVWYLARSEGMSAEGFHRMVNHESGLLGVSETSGDMRDLLAREAQDVRAAEAIALYCYHIRKSIGAFSAAMGGLDILVFSGGVGENSPVIRRRICQGLELLGVRIDDLKNTSSAHVISTADATVEVRVIATDEELVIARAIRGVVSPA